MNTLEQLAARITEMQEDIRAEVIVSELLSGGFKPEDILVRLTGQLKRSYGSDIEEAKTESYREYREHLVLHLNRDSIYDALPEGIFHQPTAKKGQLSVAAMVADYRRRKEEENEARQFFAPFENEFFYQKARIASLEYQQLTGLHRSRLDDAILDFFGIDPGLPRRFGARLVRLLPYAGIIAGNPARTETVFSLLLNVPVKLSWIPGENEELGSGPRLGEASLGTDLTAGEQLPADYSRVVASIGPVEKAQLTGYLSGGTAFRCIQTLVDFFIPVEWDFSAEIQIQEDNSAFCLNENSSDGRLGYTTLLEEIA